MSQPKKIAFLFPGQGSQYIGMGKDFFDAYPIAKQTFEEGDYVLNRPLSTLVFEGTTEELTETKNSQLGIYIVSMAILKTIQQLFPHLQPTYCAGLSLGEYTALTAAKILDYKDGLSLVNLRAQFMNDACETTKGTMAVVLGLDAEAVEKIVREVNLPHDLWAANFNCPGQVVISGTLKGIEAGTLALKAKGAKRVLPLNVHGAFHSGLMKLAEERLTPYINAVQLKKSECEVVMNVTGNRVAEIATIRSNLIKQVTNSVRWEQGIRQMMSEDVTLYIEVGCGKALAGFNDRIGVKAPCVSIKNVTDISKLEELLTSENP